MRKGRQQRVVNAGTARTVIVFQNSVRKESLNAGLNIGVLALEHADGESEARAHVL